MRLIGLMPARNEDWVLGLSLRAALQWCDEMVVLDHASVDRTGAIMREVADEFPGRVTILEESDPIWREMALRQRMLDAARARGGTHIALIDADEVLTANSLPAIRGAVEALRPCEYLLCPLRAMWRSPFQFRVDPGNCFSTARTAVAVADHPSLCWTPARDGYDFHHRNPHGSREGATALRNGGIMHLQFADWRRITAKHALYKMTEVLRWPSRRPPGSVDEQYHNTLRERGLQTAEAPREWWSGYRDLMHHLAVGAEPWQEAEVRRLWQEHGAERFRGLNLYGVEVAA